MFYLQTTDTVRLKSYRNIRFRTLYTYDQNLYDIIFDVSIYIYIFKYNNYRSTVCSLVFIINPKIACVNRLKVSITLIKAQTFYASNYSCITFFYFFFKLDTNYVSDTNKYIYDTKYKLYTYVEKYIRFWAKLFYNDVFFFLSFMVYRYIIIIIGFEICNP